MKLKIFKRKNKTEKNENKKKYFALLPLMVVFVAAILCFSAYKLKDYIGVKRFYPCVVEYSEKSGVDPALTFAVIRAESGFNENAKSSKGAIGLMQIMPETAEYVAEMIKYKGEIDLFEPNCNVYLGCAYLNYLLKKFKSENAAVCAYNAGETKVFEWLKNSEYSDDGVNLKKVPYNETREYFKRVSLYKKEYAKYLNKKGYYAKKRQNKRQLIQFFKANAVSIYSGGIALRDRGCVVSAFDIL